ncbi:hypothetical protein DIC82_17950 [Clostridium beijerinckii]|nr:hypothetical protein DIC82_17950 [Clostridium beijerinckii]
MDTYKELERELNWIYDSLIDTSYFNLYERSNQLKDIKHRYKYNYFEEKEKINQLKKIAQICDELNKIYNPRKISKNREAFSQKLLYYTGLTKKDIIESITFEIYANEKYKLERNDKTKYINIDDIVEKIIPKSEPKPSDIIDKKKIRSDEKYDTKTNNLYPYLNRFSNMFISETRENMVFSSFWEKITHFDDMVKSRYEIKNEFNNNMYIIPNFQVYLYYAIGKYYSGDMNLSYYFNDKSMYSDGKNILNYFFNRQFEKINFSGERESSSYYKLMKKITEICDENEKHKNISFYIIEKEFNPLIINKLLKIKGNLYKKSIYNLIRELVNNDKSIKKEIQQQMIQRINHNKNIIDNFMGNTLYFIAAINPMTFANNKIFDTLTYFFENEYDYNLISVIIQEFFHFYRLLLQIALKLTIGNLIDNKEFLSLYINKGEEIIDALDEIEPILSKLKNELDNIKVNSKIINKTNYNITFTNTLEYRYAAHNTINVINKKQDEIDFERKLKKLEIDQKEVSNMMKLYRKNNI